MTGFYVYFISSLPMLYFGAPAPISFEKFIGRCEGLISEQDRRLLKSLPENFDQCPADAHPTVKKWIDFDTALRNELARIRSHARRIEPEKYLRRDGGGTTDTAFVAASAHRNPHILDAEKILDAARWAKLEELSFGHYFDLDALIIYAYKLKLLDRWERINTIDKERLLENAETAG